MPVSPMLPATRRIIEGYGGGGFRIGGERHAGSLLVSLSETRPWSVSAMDQVDLAALEPVLRLDPEMEILLLGCGETIAFVDPVLRQALRERGVVIEALDSGAACRTFNVLMAEERRVAAALIAID